MKRSYTGTVIRLIIWIVIAALLTGLLVHLISGGTTNFVFKQPFRFAITLADGGELREHSNKAFDASAVDEINVDCSVGDVEVTKSEDDQIHVRVEISEKSENRAAATSLDGGVLSIKQKSGGVIVFENYRHIVHIALPEGWEKKFTGSLSTGDITFTGTYRFTDAEFSLSTGDFEAGGVKADTLSVKGSTGDIRLDSLTAGSILLRLSTGDINVDGLTGAGILKTSTGRIDAVLSSLTGDMEITDSTGDITLTMKAPISAKITAETSVGSVRSDFAMVYTDNSVTGDKAEAEIGKPPYPSLYVKTSTGSIRINKGS